MVRGFVLRVFLLAISRVLSAAVGALECCLGFVSSAKVAERAGVRNRMMSSRLSVFAGLVTLVQYHGDDGLPQPG